MTASPIILIADRHDDMLSHLRWDGAGANCALVHAKDGKEALAIVSSQAQHITAAVIELELPLVNGLDLIGRLTSLMPKSKRIIATTSSEYEPLLEMAKHMGADAIVQKPARKNWIEEVRRLLLEYVEHGRTRGKMHSVSRAGS